MRTSRLTHEQIARALRQAEAGTPVAAVCRKLEVTETTFYRWKKRFGGESRAEALHPAADALIRDLNAALGQQLLHVSIAQWKPQVQPYCVLDNHMREAVAVLKGGAFAHSGLRFRSSRTERIPEDASLRQV